MSLRLFPLNTKANGSPGYVAENLTKNQSSLFEIAIGNLSVAKIARRLMPSLLSAALNSSMQRHDGSSPE
ncbi:MAG: hypothetical protein H6695_04735 [Deferribacteres bacterium]|nr:hypothetical protein [candidate division KSB1 bacterium]MCB9509461.1 hypothetical protein [Deferribacteres bacterium]